MRENVPLVTFYGEGNERTKRRELVLMQTFRLILFGRMNKSQLLLHVMIPAALDLY